MEVADVEEASELPGLVSGGRLVCENRGARQGQCVEVYQVFGEALKDASNDNKPNAENRFLEARLRQNGDALISRPR